MGTKGFSPERFAQSSDNRESNERSSEEELKRVVDAAIECSHFSSDREKEQERGRGQWYIDKLLEQGLSSKQISAYIDDDSSIGKVRDENLAINVLYRLKILQIALEQLEDLVRARKWTQEQAEEFKRHDIGLLDLALIMERLDIPDVGSTSGN